jgi:hypothetical protein
MPKNKPPAEGKKRREERRHFDNALNMFGAIHDEDLANALAAADRNLRFPTGASDPLAYLGSLDAMRLSEEERQEARVMTEKALKRHSPEHLWANKLRLKVELRFVLDSLPSVRSWVAAKQRQRRSSSHRPVTHDGRSNGQE